MTYSGSVRCALGLCMGIMTIAGCSGSPTPSNPFVSVQTNQPSWMTADAMERDLVYVSRPSDGGVDAYAYPSGALEGHLQTNFSGGVCSARNGDLFITTSDGVRRYGHASTRILAVLPDPLGVPQFCAVDPATQSLALSDGTLKPEIAIYANGRGAPRLYASAGLKSAFGSLAYDGAGNLFAESVPQDVRGGVTLVELARNGAQFRAIRWSGKAPAQPGAIAWDGTYLAVLAPESGSRPPMLFRYAVRGGQATYIGQTALTAARNPLGLFLYNGALIVPSSAGITLYRYPAGGSGTKFVDEARAALAAAVSPASKKEIAVTTYHYDALRTGWDDGESSLTYKKLRKGSFGLLESVALDDQVDTQPLVVPGETTTAGASPGKHDVVYVATESNTVYAIDASSGTVLFSRNLGSPVPTPLGCNNNGPNVGIDGTPVIDLGANVMYVISYTLVSYVPTYTIHELSLSNLTDAVPPVVVSASHTLTDGSTYYFNATYQRQRPALLEANGNVYAGFGSFCDFSASQSRGWLLGWQTGSLAPLAANQLNDSLAYSPDDFFLSSIWMSGDGIAADPSGNVYFVTGNSDPGTYNGATNVQESVVKMSADLTQILSIFTPSNVVYLDQGDVDFGSGGVLLLPASSPSALPLAAAAGKYGTMFVMNQNSLGGFNASFDNVLAQKQIGGCWCGQSYFDAATDNLPRIVASGGTQVTVWKVEGSSSISLVGAGSSPNLPDGQDPGFFTAVSSNGSHRGAIIWAMARPARVPGYMTLYAFESEPAVGHSTLATLYQGTAGYWASSGGNANVAPVVANGKVYVASYKELDILGLAKAGTKFVTARVPSIARSRVATIAPHEITGTLVAIHGSMLSLRTRTGKTLAVDDAYALRHERSSDLIVGEPFTVQGAYDAAGVFHAASILRAKPSQSTWPPDR